MSKLVKEGGGDKCSYMCQIIGWTSAAGTPTDPRDSLLSSRSINSVLATNCTLIKPYRCNKSLHLENTGLPVGNS